MYVSLRNQPATHGDGVRARHRGVSRTVVLLGVTSLLTDVSSEMVTAVLPLYLVLQLALTPSQFGLVDGLYRGVSAVSGLAAGVLSDRLRRPKLVASTGYALSAATRPLMLLASSVTAVSALISVDRLGKGIRTAPRDAMIAGASPASDLGHSFGVHRAMDTVGALLGPLLSFGLLLLLPGTFEAIFVVSAAFALLGLCVIVLLVPGRGRAPSGSSLPTTTAPRLTWQDLAALGRSRSFVTRVGVAGLLTVFTVSDAFIFLSLLARDPGLATAFPLLAVGLAVAYSVLAVPAGRLADRWGRMRVYLGGHAVLLVVYAVLALQLPSVPGTVVALLLMGTFYAATDGVLAAAVSAALPEVSRASGLSTAQTVVALGGFTSSVAFGLLVSTVGSERAYLVMALGMLVALPVGARLLRPSMTPVAGR